MSEPSSNTSQTASAFYDPDSWCWRTSQGSLLSEEYPLLERLPDWWTTADGALCVQATPEHLTAARDGSALLGTPTTATSGRSPEHGRGRAPNPQELAALLPTPRTSDTNGPGIHGDGGLDLRTAAALLPTPRAQNGAPRNMKPWIRPLDEPQNLENALARLPGVAIRVRSDDGNGSSDDEHPTRPMIEDCDPSLSSG